MKANNILLLGAGFSKNFGLPLAKDMCLKISENIVDDIIADKFSKNLDYESEYQNIIKAKNKIHVNIVNKAIQETFKDIDEIVIQSLQHNKSEININLLKKFLSSFSCELSIDGKKAVRKNSIFTTNHDLLIERLFWEVFQSKNPWPFIEGDIVSENECKKFNMLMKNISDGIDIHENICEKDISFRSDRTDDIAYFKLHGSDKWKITGDILMIIGPDKDLAIKNNSLLSIYFKTFKSALTANSTVFIIGYGFNDKHIHEALIEKSVKLQVMSPTPYSQFHSEMTKDGGNMIKKKIFDKIDKYYECSLCDVFPISVKYSPLLRKLEQNLKI